MDRRPPLPEGHPKLPPERIGILLINLGTPEGTDYRSVRRYLSEFLSDRRVVELSPWLWQPLLQGVILTVRPSRSAKAYRAIWDEVRNESPLRRITRAQAEALRARLPAIGEGLCLEWAMRYGRPSVEEGLKALTRAGADRILLLPLYPQYSAATTASACDAAFRVLLRLRYQPALRTLPAYYDDPLYIAALAQSLERSLAGASFEPEVVLASFHGLPEESLRKGDPYHCHCQKTVRLLRERLGWQEDRLQIAFQSRFGPKEWLKPYSLDRVRGLAEGGVKRLAVICPGFAADCLETLEEVALGLREAFLAAGGAQFHYVSCLNDEPVHIHMLASYIARELSGWLPSREREPA